MQFIGPSAVSFPPWISSQAFPSQSPLHCRKPFLNLLQLWPHNPSIHHHPPPKRKVKGPKILCEFLLHKLLQWSRSHGSGPIGTKATGLSQGKYQLLNFIKFEITALFFKHERIHSYTQNMFRVHLFIETTHSTKSCIHTIIVTSQATPTDPMESKK